MKAEIISITLNEADQPVLAFTVSDKEKTNDQKILGALLRQVALQGIELHLVKTYPNEDESNVFYEYEIRAIQPGQDSPGSTTLQRF